MGLGQTRKSPACRPRDPDSRSRDPDCVFGQRDDGGGGIDGQQNLNDVATLQTPRFPAPIWTGVGARPRLGFPVCRGQEPGPAPVPDLGLVRDQSQSYGTVTRRALARAGAPSMPAPAPLRAQD